MSVFSDAVRDHALGLPGTVTGIACAGTPIERLTVVAGKKAFVFVGEADLRLRLKDSLADCVALAEAQPDRFSHGKFGWVKLTFPIDDPPDLELVKAWVVESYRILAPKKLSKQLAVT